MASSWEQYDFYRVLEVERDSDKEEIEKAHRQLASGLDPDKKPEGEKKASALALISANAAKLALADPKIRNSYDAKLDDLRKAESEKEKIEAKRAGKLQEQQSVAEDEKLKKATLRFEASRGALAEFYYDQLFKAAKDSAFETITPEKLMEWISSERAESMRKAEQKGRKTSFRIDWHGFTSIQEMRKKRGEEITEIVDRLVEKIQIS